MNTLGAVQMKRNLRAADLEKLEQLALAAKRGASLALPRPGHGKVAPAGPTVELDPQYRARSVDDIAEHLERLAAPEASAIAVSRMNRVVRKAERKAGDGSEVGGTPFTTLRYREPTISRLVSSHKIGHEELRAIAEIEDVYSHLCSGQILRGAHIGERYNQPYGGHEPSWPTWFLDAYNGRYKPWADEWSRRKKIHNDYTLEIVYDILFSQCTGKDIDRERNWRNGFAINSFIGGIRDYAAMAGWVGGNTGHQWSQMARENFPMRRMRV